MLIYIGETRELLSLLNNIVKRGIGVNPYPERYINMNKNYGLIIEHYSEFNMCYYDVPKAYFISANAVVGNLAFNSFKEMW